ncbi:hypothetical protein HPB49_017683 [Dermacentor silvarum]|uniref:Uncharacterized protein n=1 Tax=Dermacentor silvarum TaxID=543639 RepID=A0ACB8DEZ4_DERSI|nr:hypothetical protein HPB49_017683 [Dermacentor silvarum]
MSRCSPWWETTALGFGLLQTCRFALPSVIVDARSLFRARLREYTKILCEPTGHWLLATMQVERQHFRDRSDCLFCCINFCIGLSNLATFPHLIYDNGGLVFVAVYLILTCTVSTPMLYLEMFLGQFCGWSVPKAFEGFPMARGLGWTMLCGDLLLVVFHIPAVAYSWVYLTASLSPVIPWSVCDERDIEHRGCYQNQHGKKMSRAFRARLLLAHFASRSPRTRAQRVRRLQMLALPSATTGEFSCFPGTAFADASWVRAFADLAKKRFRVKIGAPSMNPRVRA